MSETAPHEGCWVLPNLGAEEGSDWAAYPGTPHARVAGRLFALLFSARARIACFDAAGNASSEPVAHHWPSALGPPAAQAVTEWLAEGSTAYAWLNTPTLRDAIASGSLAPGPLSLAGATPACVEALHDKAFALEVSRAANLHTPVLDHLLLAISPAELSDADAVVARLARALDGWPSWTRRRFALKPRRGTSGRGRVGGAGSVDTPSVRGALPRLARAGGAIFEPWLERTLDLSSVFRVAAAGAAPELLASFELITTASGVYRGHCGHVDANGEVGSGDREDASLRRAARAIAGEASQRGFVGPGGVDAFRYREGDPPREVLRGAVELNARPTMGFVVWGLLRRARERIATGALAPLRAGAPFAFLFTLVDGARSAEGTADAAKTALLAAAGAECSALDLSSPAARDEPQPLLILGPDRARLRAAHRAVFGC